MKPRNIEAKDTDIARGKEVFFDLKNNANGSAMRSDSTASAWCERMKIAKILPQTKIRFNDACWTRRNMLDKKNGSTAKAVVSPNAARK